jgi:predicted transcriptional regulator of viral defense system
MNYLEFRGEFFEVGCFNTHQVYAAHPDFNKDNLTRWTKQRLLIKLRQGYYAFPEYLSQRDFSLYISNRIYKPSYISLHTALAFYGIIPEAVVQITAVSSLKTAEFENDFGVYSYKKMREDLIFGYELKPFGDRTIQFAAPEKALLDLLYLYPFYNTQEEMEELRLDEDYMQNDLNRGRLAEFAEQFGSKALDKRVKIMMNTYGL